MQKRVRGINLDKYQFIQITQMLNMNYQITIKTLKKQGYKNTKIAEQIGCHRNTVRNILDKPKIVEKQTRNKDSYFEQYHDDIKNLLDQKVSRVRIHEILNDKYCLSRTYDSMCKYIQGNLSTLPQAYIVQETSPGEVAEVDFGYAGLQPDSTGKFVKTWVLSMVLTHSRKDFYTTVTNQKVESFCKALEEGFSFFGGVPKNLKVDNLKAAVIKNCRFGLEFNKDFLEFSYHYGFVIRPCTPYQPNQKGKVERSIDYVKKKIFVQRSFKNQHQLKIALRDWNIQVSNLRTHGTTKHIPQDVFLAQEKQCLLPLPQDKFFVSEIYLRIVKPNCHISFDNSYYSVPYQWVSKQVEVRKFDNIIKIYGDDTTIAIHKISGLVGDYVTVHEHYPEHRIYSETEFQNYCEQKMLSIGSNAHTLFKKLLESDTTWHRTVRKITGLCNTYGNVVVDKAIGRSLYFNAYHYATIKNICEKGLFDLACEPLLVSANLNDQRKEVY